MLRLLLGLGRDSATRPDVWEKSLLGSGARQAWSLPAAAFAFAAELSANKFLPWLGSVLLAEK